MDIRLITAALRASEGTDLRPCELCGVLITHELVGSTWCADPHLRPTGHACHVISVGFRAAFVLMAIGRYGCGDHVSDPAAFRARLLRLQR